jgi:hypothetical protein
MTNREMGKGQKLGARRVCKNVVRGFSLVRHCEVAKSAEAIPVGLV